LDEDLFGNLSFLSTAMKHFISLEEAAEVVVSASCKHRAIVGKRETADLLRMNHDSGKECHRTGPPVSGDFPRLRPFDRIIINVPNLVSDEKVLGLDRCSTRKRASRRPHRSMGSPGNTCNRTGLLNLETW
jgi:hypothetical protein